MRRALLGRREHTPKPSFSRNLHSKTFDFPENLGKIILLTPDPRPEETAPKYLARSLSEVHTLKRQADEKNFLTLFIRGTILSSDPKIQDKTIKLFTANQPPPYLPKDVVASLTPGHISLYRHTLFVSHLPKTPSNQEDSLTLDVRKAITDKHISSLYIVQLNADAIDGLDERLKTVKFKPYHLKPTNETDNCASAVSKILLPKEDLHLSNINPIAAAGQLIRAVGATQLSQGSFDKLLASIHLSGLSRSLHQVAADEALHRKKSAQASETNTTSMTADSHVNVEQSKGAK